MFAGGVAQVDGSAVRAAMLTGAARHGADYLTSEAALTASAGRVTGVRVGDHLVPTDVVVVASTEPDTGYDSSVSTTALHKVLDSGLTLAPGLRRSTVTATAVGFRPVTPDGLPLLGPVPGLDNLLIATGLAGQGLTYGPYLGACAAHLAQNHHLSLPMAAYRPDRSGTGDVP